MLALIENGPELQESELDNHLRSVASGSEELFEQIEDVLREETLKS
jgi:hypothetical protein